MRCKYVMNTCVQYMNVKQKYNAWTGGRNGRWY